MNTPTPPPFEVPPSTLGAHQPGAPHADTQHVDPQQTDTQQTGTQQTDTFSGPARTSGTVGGDDAPAGPPVDLNHLAREVTGLGPRLIAVESKVESMAGVFDDLEGLADLLTDVLPGQSPAGSGEPGDRGGEEEDEEPGLDMRVLVDWVGANVADLLERRVPQTDGFPNWCPQWWQHPEAITRFEALRRMWTVSVADPGGAMAVYFTYLDQMLAILCSDHGPFSGCKGKTHRTGTRTQFLRQQRPDAATFIAIEDDLGRPRHADDGGLTVLEALPPTGS